MFLHHSAPSSFRCRRRRNPCVIGGSQIGCAGFGFAALTSRLALRASPSVKLIWLPKIRKKAPRGGLFRIGVARFELTTFCSQSRRSTRLSYTPKCSKYSKDYGFFKRICEKNTCITFFFKKNSLLCTENIDKCPVVHYILYIVIPEPFMTRGTKWKQSMTSAKK